MQKTLKTKKIYILGGFKSGKTTLAQKLAKISDEASFYEKIPFGDFSLIDTPSIYGLSNFSDEEKFLKETIGANDLVINVINPLNIEAELFLTRQLIDAQIPVVVVINFLDEASKNGIIINFEKLEFELGVKVFPVVAVKKQGVEFFRDYILNNTIEPSKMLMPELKEFLENKTLFEAEEDMATCEKIYNLRRQKVNDILYKSVKHLNSNIGCEQFLNNILLNPITGFFTAFIIISIVFYVIGILVAGNLVNLFENQVMLAYYEPFISKFISSFVPQGPIQSLLIGDYGILTMPVRYIIGVILPLIFSFYFLMSLLEDSGYLSRLAVLTDRIFSKLGLNGKAVIPIILGLGCTTMAIITSRMLDTKKERAITSALVALTMPCSAQLGVILAVLVAMKSLKIVLIYILFLQAVFFLTGFLMNKLIKGEKSHMLMDLPHLRLPSLKEAFPKTLAKSKEFIFEATPLFVVGALTISILNITGFMRLLTSFFEPIMVHVLNLPKELAFMFIMGIIRRDLAVVGLSQYASEHALTDIQMLTGLVVLTLFVPCIIATIVFIKERGLKEASFVWFGSWFLAIFSGFIIMSVF